MRRPPAVVPGSALAAVLIAAGCSANRTVVREMGPVPEPVSLAHTPAERDPPPVADFLEHSALRPILHALNPAAVLRGWAGSRVEAYNVTHEDDVADSEWFAHRNARRPMTPAEVAGGPLPDAAPDTTGAFTIIRAKVEGITPGFTIRDRRGADYLVKFDPRDYPELSSAAEVISGRLFHAAGYHVPATYVTVLDRARLEVAPGVTYLDRLGRRRSLTLEEVQELLDNVANLPGGRVRAVASRILEGEPIGPFSFEGVRRDDPADTIPHEHRRELRGLYVMAAWLNHVDARQHNTLDLVVEEGGRRFVRHHLIDFGATLGSASAFPNIPRDGVEYDLDLGPVLARILTLNAFATRWERYRWNVVFPSIGFYSAALFRPESWTTDYPNPAFRRRTLRDGYWGAKLVASFRGEQIRAAVRAGRLSDPAAEAHLVREILARRERTLHHWFARVTPLEELQVTPGTVAEPPILRFRDLAVAHGVTFGRERSYEVRFTLEAAGLDVSRGERLRLDAEGRAALPLPVLEARARERLEELPTARRIARLEVRARPEAGAPEPRSVRVYLLPDAAGSYRIVGRAY